MIDIKEPCVVDTNVLLSANKQAPQVSAKCMSCCAQTLLNIKKSGHVVVDGLRRIVGEYGNKTLQSNGQPEAGDVFLLWLYQNLHNPKHCTQVNVTPTAHDPLDFYEFPTDSALVNFDRSDRVFVAVANAHNPKVPILQSCDTDFWNAKTDLARNGIHVEFLCRDDMQRLANRHQAKRT
jgi:hypothetical protein